MRCGKAKNLKPTSSSAYVIQEEVMLLGVYEWAVLFCQTTSLLATIQMHKCMVFGLCEHFVWLSHVSHAFKKILVVVLLPLNSSLTAEIQAIFHPTSDNVSMWSLGQALGNSFELL